MNKEKEFLFTNLDAASFLGYSVFRRYWYVLKTNLIYRKEMIFAIRLKHYWESNFPLTEFDRGFLLSIVEEWRKAKFLSPDMCRMLKIVMHDSEYWRNKKNMNW